MLGLEQGASLPIWTHLEKTQYVWDDFVLERVTAFANRSPLPALIRSLLSECLQS